MASSQFRPRYDVRRLLEAGLRRFHTQRELARAADVHEVTISRWASAVRDLEAGREPGIEPTAESVVAVAKVIGKSADEFLMDDESEMSRG